jgi:hypothetical protein
VVGRDTSLNSRRPLRQLSEFIGRFTGAGLFVSALQPPVICARLIERHGILHARSPFTGWAGSFLHLGPAGLPQEAIAPDVRGRRQLPQSKVLLQLWRSRDTRGKCPAGSTVEIARALGFRSSGDVTTLASTPPMDGIAPLGDRLDNTHSNNFLNSNTLQSSNGRRGARLGSETQSKLIRPNLFSRMNGTHWSEGVFAWRVERRRLLRRLGLDALLPLGRAGSRRVLRWLLSTGHFLLLGAGHRLRNAMPRQWVAPAGRVPK